MTAERTQVAIVGAGPAGLLLGQLPARHLGEADAMIDRALAEYGL